jgi:hypothetical protein
MKNGKIASISIENLFFFASALAGVQELREYIEYVANVDKKKAKGTIRTYSADDIDREGLLRDIFLTMAGKLHVAVEHYDKVEENLIQKIKHVTKGDLVVRVNRFGKLIMSKCKQKQLGASFINFFLTNTEREWTWNWIGIRNLDAIDIAIDIAEMLGIEDESIIITAIRPVVLKFIGYDKIDHNTTERIRNELARYDNSPPDQPEKLERIIVVLLIWWEWSRH